MKAKLIDLSNGAKYRVNDVREVVTITVSWGTQMVHYNNGIVAGSLPISDFVHGVWHDSIEYVEPVEAKPIDFGAVPDSQVTKPKVDDPVMKLDKNYKVRVMPGQSRQIQQLVFALGGGWFGGHDGKHPIMLDADYLFLYSSMVLTYSYERGNCYFENKPNHTEIQADDLIAMLIDLLKVKQETDTSADNKDIANTNSYGPDVSFVSVDEAADLEAAECVEKTQAESPQAANILQEAEQTIAQRGVMYDSTGQKQERSMPKVVAMFNAMTGHDLTVGQGWKFMCLLKLARSEQGEFNIDSFIDLAAYAALAGEEEWTKNNSQ